MSQHFKGNYSCQVVTLDYFNHFKEKAFYRIEQLEGETDKLHIKCDEFYRQNCELRKELNQLRTECLLMKHSSKD